VTSDADDLNTRAVLERLALERDHAQTNLDHAQAQLEALADERSAAQASLARMTDERDQARKVAAAAAAELEALKGALQNLSSAWRHLSKGLG
jgi:chromosome segregation ATPase